MWHETTWFQPRLGSRFGLSIRTFIAVVSVLAGITEFCRAADPSGILRDFTVRTWTKAEGLPDNSVTTLLQTRNGYLWVGTTSGLARFDGIRFVRIPLKPQGTNKTVSVTALCEDTLGSVWIGAQEQGVFCWRAGLATHYGKPEGLLDENVTSLASDSEGHVWIGTHRGLNRWDGHGFKGFTRRDGLPDDSVLAVHVARSGLVWITTRGGMCRWMNQRLETFHFPPSEQEPDQEFLGAYEDVRGNLWAYSATYLNNLTEGKRINYFPGEKSASIRNFSLCEGRGGRLWIGASGRGVFSFDGLSFQPVTLAEGRWPNDVRAVYEDQEGSLWLGIPGAGLTQLIPRSVLMKGTQGLPAGSATSILVEPGGRMCVGMESGGLYTSTGERFERLFDDTRSLGQVIPTTLCASPDGTVWVGTFGAGLCQLKDGRAAFCTTANGLSDDSVLAVCNDSEGAIWAGTLSGALHRFANGHLETYARRGGLPGTAVTALLPAREGGLWIGTANGVLLRSDSRFERTTPVPLTSRLNDKAILGLYETPERTLWIGSAGGGLGCLDAGGCFSWDSQQGLPDDVVLGIVDDSEGNLWLSTGKGLCRLPRALVGKPREIGGPRQAKLVFETDTLSSSFLNFGWPRAVRTAEGHLWFATGSGLIEIDTRGYQSEKPAPQVHIEAVLADNRPLDLSAVETQANRGMTVKRLKLPASFRSLELQFTALSFEAPEKVKFRHKLEKFEADWIETANVRSVGYGRLPGGEYEFHVTACNAQGVWNDTGAVLAFIIPTPLWRAPWVLGLYGLTAAGGVAGTVRLVSHRRLRRRLTRLEQQQAMERERMRIAQDMHDEIGSKLTKISFLSELAKREINGAGAVSEKVDSIAGTSRELLKALDEIVWAVNPRNDSLEQLCAYLSQYAREYFKDTSLDCAVHLQPNLPKLPMSAEVRHNLFLAFEESLNNVLKHSGASTVQVDVQVKAERIQISVHDDGCGFNVPPNPPFSSLNSAVSGGDGLSNMWQRLGDVGGQFTIQSEPGQGTTVTLSVVLPAANLTTHD